MTVSERKSIYKLFTGKMKHVDFGRKIILQILAKEIVQIIGLKNKFII